MAVMAATQNTDHVAASASAGSVMRNLLTGYSAEVTRPDRKSLDAAAKLMPPESPVYVASLPNADAAAQLAIARSLSDIGLRPVPHIIARKTADQAALAKQLEDLATLAQVDRALVLGGDRDTPVGEYDSALQLIQSGLFEANGIRKIAIGCYPEGHPRIAADVLDAALFDKIEAADKAGLDIRLVSQLCFDAEVIANYVAGLRNRGVRSTFRVGVAGPAKATTLLKYAAICGVGPSLRALRRQSGLSANLLTSSTPETLLRPLSGHIAKEPALAITGIHFFTFASLRSTIRWVHDWLSNNPPIKDSDG